MVNYKKWLKITFIVFLSIMTIPTWIILIFAFTYERPFDHRCEIIINTISAECGQCQKADITGCIYKRFPVGSHANILDMRLRALGFSHSESKDGAVYVLPMNGTVYRIRVIVNFDKSTKAITKLYVGF